MRLKEIHAANEFVAAAGAHEWERWSSKCTGKWSGTKDYGLLIDGTIRLFVSNGTKDFEPRLRMWTRAITQVRHAKNEYLSLLREQARKDNALARKEGLKEVNILDLGIISPEAGNGSDFFRPYVLVEVDGRQFKHSTTDFAMAIIDRNLEESIQKRNDKETYTAGAVQNPDYILGNVRFNSTDGLYKIKTVNGVGPKVCYPCMMAYTAAREAAVKE